MKRNEIIQSLRNIRKDLCMSGFTIREMRIIDDAIAELDKIGTVYDLLAEHFGVCRNILENHEEVKAWLERIRWNSLKCDELARKLEKIEQIARQGKNESRCEKILEIIGGEKEDMKTAEEVAKDIENREFTSDGMSDENWEEYMREKGVTESEIRIAASKCIGKACFSVTGPESIVKFGSFVYGVGRLMNELIEKCESEKK